LIATTASGGKAGRSPAPRPLFEARQPVNTEATAPFAGDLASHAELSRDLIIAKALARQENNLCPNDIAIR
jgi:hypothetical protein